MGAGIWAVSYLVGHFELLALADVLGLGNGRFEPGEGAVVQLLVASVSKISQ